MTAVADLPEPKAETMFTEVEAGENDRRGAF